MNSSLQWFQLTPPPSTVMHGNYDLKLVVLSYLIAVLASYVALDLVGRLRLETNPRAQLYWLLGGAFAMGAGIWSMHFIGMLAFILPMPMAYNLSWTGGSLIAAILASGFALLILRQKNAKTIHLLLGGILIGLGIATMHYMGMEGMAGYVKIRYLPGLFFLSIGIAIFASEAAIWLALQSNQGSLQRQFNLKIFSALIMGVAICGMHYTGMASAVFSPLLNAKMSTEAIRPDLLAIFVAGITGLIISLALTASTSYKQMVTAVQNEKEFLNAMLDNLEDGIIACDSTGRITVINDVLQKKIKSARHSYHLDELSSLLDLYTLDNSQPLRSSELPLQKALNGERIHAVEYLVRFKDGTSINVVIDGQPIINAHGNKLGAVIVMHDITEIKKTEKMKSEFVSVVSHELRTPLTSIRGSLGLLLGGTLGSFEDKAMKMLDIANKNCERLLLLINDILDMEKIQAGKMNFDLKTVNLNALLTEAVVTNKLYAEKYDVSIELGSTDTQFEVFADPHRLLQVMANLLSNAAKFSPPKGKITIQLQKRQDRVRVSITDQGAGIPLEFQMRIFQKFSQADSSDSRGKGGTGLGLSISKAIIEKLGGTMSFMSVPQKGSTFYFDLPILNKNQVASQGKTEAPRKQKRILICDDDEDQAKFVQVLLEGEGFYSDLAFNAQEAKQFLQENNYDVLILDLILPDQDGISLIRELRKSEKTRTLPIIVMSIIPLEGQELLNGDAFLIVDWLEKPLNTSSLLDALRRVKMSSHEGLPMVLHVEDDKDTQEVISSLLENLARVTPAASIQAALKLLGKYTYDLVILDIGLPDGNGCDLMPIFAKYKIPVIVYSAYELDQEHANYVRETLVKSQISNNELLSKIKKLLHETIEDPEHAE